MTNVVHQQTDAVLGISHCCINTHNNAFPERPTKVFTEKRSIKWFLFTVVVVLSLGATQCQPIDGCLVCSV